MTDRPVGKTKDQGWEIGVRRTFPISPATAWEIMVVDPGLAWWFGEDPNLTLEKGATFHTTDRTDGKIVGYNEGSLLRARWQPKDWPEPSTLQLRIIPAGEKATIAIHHERLADAAHREAMRRHWTEILERVPSLISAKGLAKV